MIQNHNNNFHPIELLCESSDESVGTNDNTNVTQTTRVVADNSDSIMYTPSFYRQEITSNKSNDDIAKIFQKANWITPELQAEIECCYPSPGEWTSNSIERNISYSKQAYLISCFQ